jgi:hypothetical protein
MPQGLARAYLLVLAPAAFLAPLPLLWTDGAGRKAILLYELGLLYLWWRARAGRTVRVSDAAMNVAGLLYLAWLGYSVVTLRTGLLPTVTHLLLFTGLAKLASLKRPSEARLALLVVFLLALAAASTSTHVASLLYFAAMAWVGFRTLGLLAVLADFDQAPPEKVLESIPTRGVALVAIAAGALCTAPLFFALPRLHGPYAVAPFRIGDAYSRALAADRVDLAEFGAAKRSDRVILRISSEPDLPRGDGLRLREADFVEYQDGVWVRNPSLGGRRGQGSAYAGGPEAVAAVVSVDLNVYGQGFLFLPYGTSDVRLEKGRASELTDGVLQVSSGRGTVRYNADVRRGPALGPGKGRISAAEVPDEVRQYALRLTSGLTDPREIYGRIEEHLLKDFIYTLDPPPSKGDPIAQFLLRSRAGHCEYFASAAAMMLAARGVPARLVTGSFGGEEGLFSRSIIVRAQNLHAWVEADLDGSGFEILDPTPPAGVPPALRTYSLFARLASLGREIEFFYDRHVLGFDAGDQVGAIEAARESLGEAANSLTAFGRSARELLSPANAAGLLGLMLAAWLLARLLLRRRRATTPETRAYLALRDLLARRGPVSDATPPAEVARLLAEQAPEGRDDAAAVVSIYCASAFGGVEAGAEERRDLAKRVRRLKKLA